MRYVEVEQKFELRDPESLRRRLLARNATVRAARRQVDTYFNPPHRDFLASEVVSEWFRVRLEDGGAASVNYKRWHPLDAVVKTHCDEYETPVTDVEAVRRMLTALDFSPIVEVDKHREEWYVDGDPPVLVAIDTIAGVGTFAEFEFRGAAATPEEALALLDRFVAGLAVPLGDRVHRGYPHIMLGRKH